MNLVLGWFLLVIFRLPASSAGGAARPAEVLLPPGFFAAGVYRGEKCRVAFKSDAPLEMIEAKSGQLRGVINPIQQTFAWAVDIKSFNGFNSPLQREHFNEAYLETTRFPQATFTGKIIEKIDYQQDGSYPVRAKGKLVIHGIEQERIIKSILDVRGKKLVIRTNFPVPLADHDIAIPKIVHQKIAEEVDVTIEGELLWKE